MVNKEIKVIYSNVNIFFDLLINPKTGIDIYRENRAGKNQYTPFALELMIMSTISKKFFPLYIFVYAIQTIDQKRNGTTLRQNLFWK